MSRSSSSAKFCETQPWAARSGGPTAPTRPLDWTDLDPSPAGSTSAAAALRVPAPGVGPVGGASVVPLRSLIWWSPGTKKGRAPRALP